MVDFLPFHPFYSVTKGFLGGSLDAEMINYFVFSGLRVSMIIKRFIKTAGYQAYLHFLQFGFEWKFPVLLKHETFYPFEKIF